MVLGELTSELFALCSCTNEELQTNDRDASLLLRPAPAAVESD